MIYRPRISSNKAKRQGRSKHLVWIRGSLLLMFGAAITAIWLLDIDAQLNMEAFRTHHSNLAAWVEAEYATAAIAYVAFYVTLVLFLIPGPFFATLVGGVLFGPIGGTLLTVLGATAGAVLVFIITKTVAGGFMEKWVGKRAQPFVAGFKRNELNYMFVLRLIPLFPFSLITISAAILGVKFRNFFLATVFGIAPNAYIITLAGASVADFINTARDPSLSNVFTPQAIAALTGLVFLVTIPMLYRWVKR
mgnify:CR=1 FL=1